MISRRAFLILSAVAFVGVAANCCGLLNPASRLYGKWKLDVEATIDRATGGNDLQAGLARAAWGVFGGDIIVEFRSDGTGTFTGRTIAGGTTEEGSWAVNRTEGDLFVVQFVSDESGESREVELLMKDENTFEMQGDDGNVAIFRRVTE